MKTRDIIILIIALVLAFYIIKIIRELTAGIIFLIVAYFLYLFLKKML
ncbi:MAG: hypothetical protein KKI06_07315 [Euryarchaeota archaeon]|nr:hypothetical protein [Euryarchaeota archaeon]MBU4223574.1 hypothetical protein [Euryarchaeota archaeon]MCG2738404.1 hypothetical protein [Candidatus Methanoperedenaceae archaeon]